MLHLGDNPPARATSRERSPRTGAVDPDTVTPASAPSSKGSDPLVVIRKVIVGALNGQIPENRIAEAVTVLRYAYDHGDDDLRSMTVMALTELGPSRAAVFPLILAATRDTSAGVRKRAVRAAGQAGDRAATGLTFLMSRLIDESEAVRCEAVAALGELGHRADDAVPALMSLLTHSVGRIRAVIGITLRKIGEGAIPYLLAALVNPDDDSRERAAALLGSMEIDDPDLVEALLGVALSDPLGQVRDTARRALSRIEDASLAGPCLAISE